MRLSRRTLWAIYLLLLVVLATANAGSYRYGASDQAFYIPSILDDVQPQLFPRDAVLLRAQDRLMVSDELLAAGVTLGAPLPVLMLSGYVASLLVLFGAALAIGRQYYAHAWTAAAFCAALTLRHRITKTGANSFEGYFHPRVSAFACGVAAVAAVARDHLALAWGLTLLACVLHPTTGVWWAVWLLAVCWVVRPAWRRPLLIAGLCAVPAAIWLVTRGPLAGRFAIMDEPWIRLIASKDYVFPDEWSVGSWLVNLFTAAVPIGVWRLRVAQGVARPWEGGAVLGVVALVALFLVSLPFIDARLALAVQLQTSRVFWLVDFFAVAAMTWLLAEGWQQRSGHRLTRPALVCAVVVAAAVGRGAYGLLIEHPERSLVQATLERNAWQDVGAWVVRATPADAHLLGDPDHAWKFGLSLRVVAERDVLIESVKDTAVAMYSREIALRVQERIDAVGAFDSMTPDRARALARRYDLDYLVTDRQMAMPEAYRNADFYVYRLQ